MKARGRSRLGIVTSLCSGRLYKVAGRGGAAAYQIVECGNYTKSQVFPIIPYQRELKKLKLPDVLSFCALVIDTQIALL